MDEMELLRGVRPPGPNPDAAARTRMRERLTGQLQAGARTGLLRWLSLLSSNRLRVAMAGALTAAVAVGAIVGTQTFVSSPQEPPSVQGGPPNVTSPRHQGEPSASATDDRDNQGESPSEAASPSASSGDGDESGTGRDRGVPNRNLARLVDLTTHAGNTYSRVDLHFEPGEERPSAHVEESDDSTVRRPGSGEPVRLAGDQALRVTVSSMALAGDVGPVKPQGPAIAEARVLGFFEGETTLAIGVYGKGDLTPEVSYQSENLSVIIHNPTEQPPSHACGKVGFEPNTDHGAFDIVARGVSCQAAREIAATAEGQVGESYETSNGFTCLPDRDTSGPMPSVRYTCSRGVATVTFTAS